MTLILLLLLLLMTGAVAGCRATNVGSTRVGRMVGPYAPDVTDESYISHQRSLIHTEEVISRYLAKPKAKRVTIRNHGPWNNQTLVCLSCNRSAVEIYSNPVMLECYA